MLKDKVILLVDDEAPLLKATKAGLVARGFTVEAAEGAEAALRVIHDVNPDLVVTDLVMPGTNGFELYQRVKAEYQNRNIPFVFLTAVDDFHAKKFGKEIGAAAYITKPVDLDELEGIIKEKLGA